MIWACLLSLSLAGEPSPEALFEAHTLELQQAMVGYEVLRDGEAITASQFAGLVGDVRGLAALDRARRKQHRSAVGAMAASALCIGGGSFVMAHGLGRNVGEDRGGGPTRQMAAGGGVVLAGLGLYGVTAGVLIGKGPRLERVDQHYQPDEAAAWMGRYHEVLQTQLGVDVQEGPE